MPANEFEKQVQKQLDDFQLNPSASVWKKVEEQIRKKKRRRIIFFFFLPVLLGLLSYSVYYFFYTGPKTEFANQTVAEKSKGVPPTDNSNAPEKTKEQDAIVQQQENDKTNKSFKSEITQQRKKDNIQKDKQPIVSKEPSTAHRKDKVKNQDNQVAKAANKPTSSLIIDNTAPEKTGIPAKNEKAKKDVNTKDQTDRQPATKNDPVDGTVVDPKDSLFAKQDFSKDKIETQPVKTNDPTNDIVVNPKDSVPAKTDTAKTEEVVKADNKNTIAKKNPRKSKIKWGIDLSLGITSGQSSVFSLNKSYFDAIAFSNSPAASAGAYPGRSLTLPPSSTTAGPAFRAGVFGEWQLSTRSKISVGLQYSYVSNRIKTGTPIANNTSNIQFQPSNNFGAVSADQVYRGPQKNSYTNSYHFVSMPLEYHWQINKSKKLPVQWNVGVLPGYLLSTNALVYSSSYGGIYYYDKSAVNKFHLAVGTGLSLTLKAKKGMEYMLGPELSFDTRKLINNSYQKNQYSFYWGIRTRILLPSGKNK